MDNAVHLAPNQSGVRVLIVEGRYVENLVIERGIILEAPVGTVEIIGY